jgi:hypothetical protein
MRMLRSSATARAALLVAGSTLALTVAGTAVDQAHAQAKLTANYTISVARIPVGKITWSTDIGDDTYTSTGSGEASGIASFLASGKGALSTRGTVKDGQLSPTEFTSDITQDDEKGALKMVLDQGAVTELKADAPAASADRVPVTAAHQQGVVDPLTAWLIPAAGEGNGLGRAACERTLPIFDGQKRYDLKLAFKRMDKMKADKSYDGPVLVCAVTFQPIAGHRPASPTVKFLAGGREIELWLAPVAGTRALAPIRVSVANMLGNIVVQASEFQATAQSPMRASIRVTPQAD